MINTDDIVDIIRIIYRFLKNYDECDATKRKLKI